MKFIVLALLVFVATNGNAQLKGFSLGPYAEVARPAGEFSETHKNGYGAGLGADIRLGLARGQQQGEDRCEVDALHVRNCWKCCCGGSKVLLFPPPPMRPPGLAIRYLSDHMKIIGTVRPQVAQTR